MEAVLFKKNCWWILRTIYDSFMLHVETGSCVRWLFCDCMNVIFVSAKLLAVYTCTVLMESSQEETLHDEQLNLQCRVCGVHSKRFKAFYAKLSALVTLELQTFHRITILDDRPNRHSGTVCSKCYSRLMTLKYSVIPSSTTLEKAKADVESTAKLWARYDSELLVTERPVLSSCATEKRRKACEKRFLSVHCYTTGHVNPSKRNACSF